MPPNVDLIKDSDWICDVLTDIGDTLMKAGFDTTPKLIYDCRLALVFEAKRLRNASENAPTIAQKHGHQLCAQTRVCIV